ncbi:MAG: type III-B CRISPR module RAMP protein Cmr6 [Bacteroidia bacterium]
MSKTTANLGYIFYREYYQKIEDPEKHQNKKQKEDYEKVLNIYNQKLFGAKLDNFTGDAWPAYDLEDLAGYFKFELQTTYPGLFIGAGVSHETGAQGEIKLGFQFDPSTGLPVIPGSSIKGCLRHYLTQMLNAAKQYPSETATYLSDASGLALTGENIIPWLDTFIKTTFEGPDHPYKRDVFFDAFPFSSENTKSAFLGPDFITPHGNNPLKNPIPVQFMKILPGVSIRFTFRLESFSFQDLTLSEEAKSRLFEKLLKDWGIGAKSRSGYGRLVPFKKNLKQVNQKPQSSHKPGRSTRSFSDYTVGEEIDCKVIGYEKNRLILELQTKEKNSRKRTVKDIRDFPLGTSVKIKITSLITDHKDFNFELVQ